MWQGAHVEGDQRTREESEDIKDFFLPRSTAITCVDERHGPCKPSQTETLGFLLYMRLDRTQHIYTG